jgi:hypothetical protein
MAREIKPTPILEGQDVIDFYKKLAGFKENFERLGITRETIERDAAKLRAIFKENRDEKRR